MKEVSRQKLAGIVRKIVEWLVQQQGGSIATNPRFLLMFELIELYETELDDVKGKRRAQQLMLAYLLVSDTDLRELATSLGYA